MNKKGVLQITILMLAATLLVLPVSGAFAVTGITPDSGINTGPVFITNLSGTDLPEQANVRLALPAGSTITGKFVTWVSPTRITCVFDLTGEEAGVWDVIVVNTTDDDEAILPGGFSIRNPAPTVTAITPDEGVNTGEVAITALTGTNFLAGADVVLTRTSLPNITGTSVAVINPTTITCEFDLAGAETGDWNVVVTNPDGQSASLTAGFTVRLPAPVVTGIVPALGKNTEVIGITNLAGANFREDATVILSREGEANITTIDGPIVTPTKILCFFDLNGKAAGPWDVVVINPDGQYDVLPSGFAIIYPQPPAVSGITPSTGTNSGIVPSINVTGTGFQPGAAVKLVMSGQSDIPGTLVDVQSSSKIRCDLNLSGAKTGAWDVVVTNNDGQVSVLPGAFTVTYPAPTVTGIDPGSGLTSDIVTISNLSGTGFLDGASVRLIKSERPDIIAEDVVVVTPEQITCTFDLTGADPGYWGVKVINPDLQSAILPGAFVVAYPPPLVSGITPSSGTRGQLVQANITGNGFLAGCTVNFTREGEINVSPLLTSVMGTRIACSLDLSGIASGLWNLTVTNPDGQVSTLPGVFTVTNPPPVVSGASPDTGINSGNTGIITLTGMGFLDGATVRLSRVGQPDIASKGVPVVENGTSILCFFDLTGATTGFWDIVVTNPDLQSGSREDGFFISYPSAPEIIGIEPDSGINNGPVAISNISGSGFQPGATVVLRKTGETPLPATEVSVVSANRITCNFNLAGVTIGSWEVAVINDDGQSGALIDGFTVRYPAPVIQGITPSVGLNNGTQIITNLSGIGFLPGATVKLTKLNQSDIVATNVTVINSGKISCSVDLTGRATGLWNVLVMNPDSQYGIRANIFTVENPAPSVIGISPNKGPNNAETQNCTITGTGFLPGALVQLTRTGYTPVNATMVTVETPTKITCAFNLSGTTTGKWNVVVRNTDMKSGILGSGFEITPPPPVPDFTADPLLGTAPLTVQFADRSKNSPALWVWNFGDGTSAAGLDQQNPVHTYQKPGQYTVLLQVTNKGGTTQIVKQGYITVVSTPIARFAAVPQNGSAPLLVQFTDNSDGEPSQWFWSFGDGGFSSQQNPYHLYQKPGNYTVSLTAYNRAGSDTVTRTDLIRVTSRPIAAFTANRTTGVSPLTVKFTDLSQGSPTSWSWTFGDSGTSSEQNPIHTFAQPGSYSVQLRVQNGAGNSTEVKEGYIQVNQGLMADFEYTTSNPDHTAPLTVAFTDRSLGKPILHTWRFGDGFSSTERNPIHNYPNPGTYNVTLSVNDLSGSSSMTKTIVVRSPLNAEFFADPVTGSAPLTVVLTDTSVGQPSQRYWVINKGLSVVVLNPGEKQQAYTINEPGLYNVTLHVQDASGATSDKVKFNYINVLEFPPE